MHLLVRDTASLDEAAPAEDLALPPADILFLSFSDSDLNAAAAAAPAGLSLCLVNLARLRHPMSVDLWIERSAARARMIVLRLLGGIDYWRYGAEELAALARRRGIALAMLPGDVRQDAQLATLSTVSPGALAQFDALLRHGGTGNLRAVLDLAAHLGGLRDAPGAAPVALPDCGVHDFGTPGPADAVIVFYRAWLLAADIAPIIALAEALRARGLGVRGLFVGSLKDAASASFVAESLRAWRPRLVLNATGFSARGDGASPLDAADAPVLQLVLSGARRTAWEADARGLGPADLAMQVVLPELDGRLLTTAISFKQPDAAATPPFARTLHAPDEDGIALAADRAAGWVRLATTPRASRRLAIVLPDYPDLAGQAAYAVGLDTLASLRGILGLLRKAGYAIKAPPDLETALCHAAPTPFLSLARYHALFAGLPPAFQQTVLACWGAPEADPAIQAGQFVLRHATRGGTVLAIQPDRGCTLDRVAGYHDAATPPRHAYIAFHLWLREEICVHALLHLGTHGTLEWLPGKAAALSAACAPAALLRGLPVIYPYIVSNPGEAAAAKRRLGAVTIGHLTPPLGAARQTGAAAELERLIDDLAAADGLDARRCDMLRRDILARAASSGMLDECGIDAALPEADQLQRLDAFLCDVKNLRVRTGLHVFGAAPAQRDALLDALRQVSPGEDGATLDACPAAEREALLAALDGRFIQPGPAGAPTRGRLDVLPTGRNLTTLDPRAVPTRAALMLAERAAEALLRRHVQEQGDWPRALVIDLWGSATMRTGGEDFALALLLLGATPIWESGGARVTGVDILPLATLDRPRIDVTLRISGLFRDAFPMQIALFDQAVRAIAARDEDAAWNPLAGAARGLSGPALRQATARIFGAAPGDYGAGVSPHLARGAWESRATLGEAYVAASGFAYGNELEGAPLPAWFGARIAASDAFLHVQDHDGTDMLDGIEHAAHEGGYAAAAAQLGANPALYHADTTTQDAPRIRTMAEEIARVTRGRPGDPLWVANMLRHGWNGGAEVARALDGLHGFAATLPTRFDRQFDLVFAATLGHAGNDAALRAANSHAHAAMRARFREALRRGLWHPRGNLAGLGEDS